MALDRRAFLKTLTIGVAGTGLYSLIPEYLLADNSDKFKNGIRFENGVTLINRDKQNSIESLAHVVLPGTKNIKIKNIFLNYLSENQSWAKNFDKGLDQLNSISQKKYGQTLSELKNRDKRIDVVTELEKESPKFFSSFRIKVIKFYYSHPYSWKKLGYNGPPQPAGFMDYYLPPKA